MFSFLDPDSYHQQGFLLLLSHVQRPGLEALCSDLLRAAGGLPSHQVRLKRENEYTFPVKFFYKLFIEK